MFVPQTVQIQDMPDPEYFLGAYGEAGESAWRTTAFSDAAVPDAVGRRAIWERKPLFCVPIPGQEMPKAPTPGVPDPGIICSGLILTSHKAWMCIST